MMPGPRPHWQARAATVCPVTVPLCRSSAAAVPRRTAAAQLHRRRRRRDSARSRGRVTGPGASGVQWLVRDHWLVEGDVHCQCGCQPECQRIDSAAAVSCIASDQARAAGGEPVAAPRPDTATMPLALAAIMVHRRSLSVLSLAAVCRPVPRNAGAATSRRRGHGRRLLLLLAWRNLPLACHEGNRRPCQA